MLVSIIVPCYNSEKYLENTVKSILKQSYDEIEIILINDGSKDKTVDIIKKFAKLDNRVKLMNQKNRGVSSARNHGLKVAKGKYITFLDSDDTYEAKKISKQVEALKKSNKKVCVCSNRYIFNKNIVNHIQKENGKKLDEYILNHTMHLNDFMIEAEFLNKNKINFSENLKFGEDSAFIMKVLYLEEVICVKEQLTNYFIRSSSSSFNTSIRINNQENYISDIKNFIFENKSKIYNHSQIEKINNLLENFLQPQVIIRNIIYCKKNINEMNEFEVSSLKKFKLNTKNLKSSAKFYILYFKLKLKWKKINL